MSTTLRADARSETPPAAVLAPPDEAARRRGVVAAVIGNTLEFYDFTTYAFFAVTIGRTFFPAGDAWVSLLASVATFGIGFVTRPIGGVVIGAYADRAGRKPAMMLTIALMAIGMLMLALTPGYATIGLAAPVLVVIGRLIQGFALGGEVGPSTAYLIESAPPGRRGLYASWQIASQGLATLCAGTIGVLLSLGLSADQMQAWGWRIPFLLGLLIIPVGIYIRRAMPFGNARSLSDDDVYALTAYVLYLNDIVTDEDFELSKANFTSIKMPNQANFIADDRFQEPEYAANRGNPCMKDCAEGKAKITMHAEVLDVTPQDEGDDKKPSSGIE